MLESAGRYDGCVSGGVVIGGGVSSGGVRRYCSIGLVWWLVTDAVICFCMPSQTEGEAYSVGGRLIYQRRRRKGKLAQIMRK